MTRTVLITGAGQGIGAETAHVLAERGWRIISADLNYDAAKAASRELDRSFPVANDHLPIEVNVADEASVAYLFDTISKHIGALDGLVNCAGVIYRQAAENYDFELWRQQLDIHLTGAFLLSKRGFSLLSKAVNASIVNVGSVGSTFGLPGRVAYTTSKSGILGLTRTLAVEWGEAGIRVNAVAPGYVATDMVLDGIRTGALDEKAILARTPLRRLAQPREIATAIAFLLSEDATFIHGATLKIDGGLTVNGAF